MSRRDAFLGALAAPLLAGAFFLGQCGSGEGPGAQAGDPPGAVLPSAHARDDEEPAKRVSAAPLEALSQAQTKALARASSCVVAIRKRGASRSTKRKTRTGVLVAPGLVLTDARNVDVFGLDDLIAEDHEGRTHLAQVRGRDLRLRLVLLAVPTLKLELPPYAPPRTRRAGAFVLALGAPLRRGGVATTTWGILSAPGRFQGRADQLDAPVDASNLGGPIVDLEGRLLGVLVRVDGRLGRRSGVAFAVPLEVVLPVLPLLDRGQQLEPGTLGVHLPRVASDTAPGVEVIGATGPAARAGIARGDRILELAGRPTPDLVRFRRASAFVYAGQRVRVRLSRAGVERSVDLVALPQP